MPRFNPAMTLAAFGKSGIYCRKFLIRDDIAIIQQDSHWLANNQ